MKSIFQFLFSLFFVSLLLGQETAFDRSHPNRNIRLRQEQQSTRSLQRSSQSPNPMHKIAGSGVDTAWVRHYGSGSEVSYDAVTSCAIDADGNVYVTGESGEDYATVKYSPSGDTAWVRRYNGSGLSVDRPTSIAVDEDGNVYITGVSGNDYLTIRYTPFGDMAWVRRFANGLATSLAVDDNGSVYVTGTAATIKYNSTGDILWNRSSSGNALSLDGSGNVYVTGDTSTIKYTSTGDILWNRSYTTENNFWGRYSGTALCLDGSGNVYVTLLYDSHWDHYFSMIKYTSSGDTVWVREHDQDIFSLNVDTNGNVYVAGSYFVIKYTPFGVPAWTKICSYVSASLGLDLDGNVYVTGGNGPGPNVDYLTFKYGASGDTIWMRRYNGPGESYDHCTSVAIDAEENVYVTGGIEKGYGKGIEKEYATIKYTSSGKTAWVKRYDGLVMPYDQSTFVAVDADKNIFVTGMNGDAYMIIKYSQAGDTLWTRQATARWLSGPKGMAVDASGNVFITGHTGDNYNQSEYTTLKYNSSGDLAWGKKYTGPYGFINRPASLVADDSGNVYVTGTSHGSISSNNAINVDYVTIKYSSSGDVIWINRYNGSGSNHDVADAVTVDATGNVYVTGISWVTFAGSDYDFVTLKYSPTGALLWEGKHRSITHQQQDVHHNDPSTLAVDVQGNVFVLTGKNGMIKYGSDGEQRWHIQEGSTTIAVDPLGNAYVVGNDDSSTLTSRYDPDGVKVWSARFSLIISLSIERNISRFTPVGVRLDASGNVYVSGTSYLGRQSFYTIIKYKQTPTAVKEISHELPSSFAIEQNYPNPFNPSTTIRYALSSAPLGPDPSPTGRGDGLPAGQAGVRVKLTIHDLLGREVATLVNEEQTAGWKEVQWNASNFVSGMYLVRMVAGNFNETKKILLMK